MAYVCRDFFGRFSTTKERFWTFFLWVAKLPMRATFAERPMCVRAASALLERLQASEAVGWVLLVCWVRGGAAALLVDGACRSNPLTTVAGQRATSAVILAKQPEPIASVSTH